MIKSITSHQYKKLIAWLKREREAQGVSMRVLSARIDCPHQFIGKVESGERRLDVYEYVQYCDALNLDPCIGIGLLK
jgi:transcriptional regulator with XRE-family HTH domain